MLNIRDSLTSGLRSYIQCVLFSLGSDKVHGEHSLYFELLNFSCVMPFWNDAEFFCCLYSVLWFNATAARLNEGEALICFQAVWAMKLFCLDLHNTCPTRKNSVATGLSRCIRSALCGHSPLLIVAAYPKIKTYSLNRFIFFGFFVLHCVLKFWFWLDWFLIGLLHESGRRSRSKDKYQGLR